MGSASSSLSESLTSVPAPNSASESESLISTAVPAPSPASSSESLTSAAPNSTASESESLTSTADLAGRSEHSRTSKARTFGGPKVIVVKVPCRRCRKPPRMGLEEKLMKKTSLFNGMTRAVATMMAVAGWVYMNITPPDETTQADETDETAQPYVHQPVDLSVNFKKAIMFKKGAVAAVEPPRDFLKFLQREAGREKGMAAVTLENENERQYYRMLIRWFKKW